MRADTASWLAAGVAGPLVGVWLGWAALIVYSHRAQWRLLDPLLLALLLLAIARQLAAAALTAVHLLRPSDDWCSALAFLLAAADAMQAATLATLVFSKFLHLRLPRDKFRKTLSKSHLIYHLACLVLISSCIGVAAVIGKTDHCVYYSDKRYISFWLTLHSALIVLSFCVLIYSSCLRGSVGTSVSNTYYQNQRRLLLNSSSDLSCALSDISMLSSKSRNRGVNYSVSNCSSNLNRRHCLVEELLRNQVYVNGDCKFVYNTQLSCGSGSVLNDKLSASQQMLTEELRVPEEARLMEDSASCAALHDCHLSTTTTSPSSTNSRAPVLAAKHRRPDLEVQLITVAAVSVLCFFTSHLPVMAVAFMEVILQQSLGLPWSSENFPIWASLVEGCLLPVVLLIFDDQFPARIAHIYKRRSPADVAGKPPQGLYGKFRPFNNSSMMESRRTTMEPVRFPITNGSLFTSLDGRIPIVHNYRRGKCITRSTSGMLSNKFSGISEHGGSLLISNMVSVGSSMERKPPLPVDPSEKPEQDGHPHSHQPTPERGAHSPEGACGGADRDRDRDALPQTVKQLREKLFLKDHKDFYDSSDEEPVYATLSSQSICSATTAANDDFEFFQHDSKEVERASGASTASEPAFSAPEPPAAVAEESRDARSVNSDSHSRRSKERERGRESPAAGRHRKAAAARKTGEPRWRGHALRDSQRHRRSRSREAARRQKSRRSPIVKRRPVTAAHWRPASSRTEHPGYNHQRPSQEPCRMKSTSLSVLNEHDRTLSSEEGARSSPHPHAQAHPHAHPHSKPAYHRYHPGGRRVRMRHGHSHGHHPREFPPTPPTPRRLAPILSVDSLVSALNDTGVSYLDNGEVFIHPNSSSVPDLKKIFITDFL